MGTGPSELEILLICFIWLSQCNAVSNMDCEVPTIESMSLSLCD